MDVGGRALVEKELNRLTSLEPVSPMSKNAERATINLYPPDDRERRKFQRELIDDYISDGADVSKDAFAALVTAGPPGAGKSQEIQGLQLAGYRVVDADRIKTSLLQKALADGIYERFLSWSLPGGGPVLLNELSSLVHSESLLLADEVIDRSLNDQVNVVIEGTFSWPDLVDKYLRLLIKHDYRHLTVVDVEVDFDTACRQASDRWWNQRVAALNHTGPADGGRFMPHAAIQAAYGNSGRASICNANATALFNDSRTRNFEKTELIVQDNVAETSRTHRYESHGGTPVTPVPKPLNESL